ncbi:MAG TPA: hypothetical protein VEK76_01180 [Candidatus Binatia bacterium]|nr:hypothetical protein [Candidatus Binatia bacterium]
MMTPDPVCLPVPRYRGSTLAIAAPGNGPGNWVGAPSAILDGTAVLLAYRLRRPVEEGRGMDVVLARSEDHLHFDTVASVSKEPLGAESLERPALVRSADGRWRLYLSCATPGTKHWRVELLEASQLENLPSAPPRVVLPGDAATAVKDPVIQLRDGTWEMWACLHPLDDPDATDRMWTAYALSDDGVEWHWQGDALRPRPGAWDQRGTRITAVWRRDGGWLGLYDGRASAEENFEERTGLARGASPARLTADAGGPIASSPHGGGALRYACILPLPGGGHRLYYEAAREDGAHELRTELVGAP